MTLDRLARDLRFALRSFRREPAFVAGIVLTFALSIGATAAMFGLVQRLMLAPPPGVRAPDQVARVRVLHRASDGTSFGGTTTSYPMFRALAARDAAFAGVGAFSGDTMMVGRGADAAPAKVVAVTGGYFATLGTRAALGRLIGADEDAPPDGSPVVVVSHAWWRRTLGGAPDVLGRTLLVDEVPLTIVGVAPPDFNGTEPTAADLYVPMSVAFRTRDASWTTNAGMNLLTVVVRVPPAAAPAAVLGHANAAAREVAEAGGLDATPTIELESIVPGAAARATPQARVALWLAGVAFVVLLVATANVGTLQLLRAARRERELAVRLALGAGPGRLAQQLLVESLLLALVGGAAGWLCSRWIADLVRATLLPGLAPSERMADPRLLALSFALAAVAGLLAGVGPVVRLVRRDVSRGLRQGAAGASRRLGFQNLLVAVQVALCTVLLVGAGLFVRSLHRVTTQDLGFSTARLLYADLQWRSFVPGPERDAAHRDAVARLLREPGVVDASVVEAMPFGSFHVPPIAVPGLDGPPNVGGQMPMMYAATPSFLSMMGVRLREGRLLTARDDARSAPVVLVNETMARVVWPGRSAIGQCVQAGFDPLRPDEDPMEVVATLPCREVVGVVRDTRVRSLRAEGDESHLMQFYVPFEQLPAHPMPGVPQVNGILVQVAGSPDEAAARVQRAIQGALMLPALARVRPYQDLLEPQLRSWRLGATLFTVFGALALAIAGVGLFGVISYLVSQRTREIGVRLALGGTSARVRRLVVGDALRLVSLGALVGGAIALLAGPFVQPLLYQVSAREPTSLLAAIASLLVVGIAAALVPAWRAGRVAPAITLRAE